MFLHYKKELHLATQDKTIWWPIIFLVRNQVNLLPIYISNSVTLKKLLNVIKFINFNVTFDAFIKCSSQMIIIFFSNVFLGRGELKEGHVKCFCPLEHLP